LPLTTFFDRIKLFKAILMLQDKKAVLWHVIASTLIVCGGYVEILVVISVSPGNQIALLAEMSETEYEVDVSEAECIPEAGGRQYTMLFRAEGEEEEIYRFMQHFSLHSNVDELRWGNVSPRLVVQ
jgi:hypothetical protein